MKYQIWFALELTKYICSKPSINLGDSLEFGTLCLTFQIISLSSYIFVCMSIILQRICNSKYIAFKINWRKINGLTSLKISNYKKLQVKLEYQNYSSDQSHEIL